MRLVDKFLQYLQQGIDFVLKYVKIIWVWSATQIENLPWDGMGNLSAPKLVVLAITAGLIVYLLYSSIRELLEAGHKALSAFVTLLSVVLKTLIPLFLAGLAAAGGAWLINTFNF
jgi:hypothetical protein